MFFLLLQAAEPAGDDMENEVTRSYLFLGIYGGKRR